MKKITVVTITFNLIKNGRKDWFIQNLESVHNQTYQDFEHIIIDGASTDGTVELLEEYQNKGYIKYYSEPDNGIYDAMNKGMQRATGEYITYLNSDDFYHAADALAQVAKVLTETDADFLSGNALFIREDGTKYCVQKTRPEIFFAHMPFCHQTLFVKTDLMKKLGGFDAGFKSAGDYDFIIRMFLSGAYGITLPYTFVSFRLGGLSYTQAQLSKNEVCMAMKNIYSNIVDCAIDYELLYSKHIVPQVLFDAVKQRVHPKLLHSLDLYWKKSKKYDEQRKKVNTDNIVSYVNEWCLFDFISLLRISKRRDDIKYFVFWLPLFYKKTLSHEKIYRILCVPLFKIRYNSQKTCFYLYKIPVFSYRKQ